ncbi:MAG: hypothetical protein AAF962_08050 [Actinomycetota bacterium]
MVLPDGVYDVMVIDATADEVGDAEGGAAGACTLSLAISFGVARGEVIDLAVDGIDIDPIELLGLPGTVEVTEGQPRFRLA